MDTLFPYTTFFRSRDRMVVVGEAADGYRIDFGDARRLKPTRPGRMVRVGVSPFEVDQRNSAQLFRRTKTETGIDNRCKLVGDQWGTRQARIGPAPIPDCDVHATRADVDRVIGSVHDRKRPRLNSSHS